MSGSTDFAKLISTCPDIEPLVALFCKSPETLSEEDRTRLLRVIMSFLAILLKVDLRITV
ncbi:MAG: hypothetical protein ACOYI2_02815 [Bacillota bacterium]|jgi:hypothetical protein|nr:hypothetical protein [Clostridia bacterium]